MFDITIRAFVAACVALTIGSTAQAALLSDDFDGSSGSAPDGAKWTVDGGAPTMDGSSNLVFTGTADDTITSNATFGSGASGVFVEFEFSAYGNGNAAFGFANPSFADLIIFDTSVNGVIVKKSGSSAVVVAGSVFAADLENSTGRIEWEADRIEFFVDGISIYEETNLTNISTATDMEVRLRRTANSSSTEVDSVVVDVIPEPASLGLLLPVLGLLFGRGRRLRA